MNCSETCYDVSVMMGIHDSIMPDDVNCGQFSPLIVKVIL